MGKAISFFITNASSVAGVFNGRRAGGDRTSGLRPLICLFIFLGLIWGRPLCLEAGSSPEQVEVWASQIAEVFNRQDQAAPGTGRPEEVRAAFIEQYMKSFDALEEQGNILAGLFLESMETDPAKIAARAQKNKANNSGEALKKLAEKNSEAQLWLGLFYRQGAAGFPKDEAEADRWLTRSAENGNAQAFEAAFFPMMVTDPEKAWNWMKALADKGNEKAVMIMADQAYQNIWQSFRLGEPVVPGSPEADDAVRWIVMSAEKGDVKAGMNLFRMYLEGLAVARNNEEALKWLRKTAENGDLGAQLTLGILYYHGGSEPDKDFEKALEYYRPKAEAGDSEAQFYLGAIRAMEAEQGGGGLNEAAQWLEKAYKGGEKRAAFILGQAYNYTYRAGAEDSEAKMEAGKKAQLWLGRAAEAGIDEALPLIEELYRQDSGLKSD